MLKSRLSRGNGKRTTFKQVRLQVLASGVLERVGNCGHCAAAQKISVSPPGSALNLHVRIHQLSVCGSVAVPTNAMQRLGGRRESWSLLSPYPLAQRRWQPIFLELL